MRRSLETGLGVIKVQLQDLQAEIPEDDEEGKPSKDSSIKERLTEMDLDALPVEHQWKALLTLLIDDHRQRVSSDKRNDKVIADGFMREFVRLGVVGLYGGHYELPQLKEAIPGLD